MAGAHCLDRDEETDSEKLTYLPKVTQLVSSETELKPSLFLLQNSILCYPFMILLGMGGYSYDTVTLKLHPYHN